MTDPLPDATLYRPDAIDLDRCLAMPLTRVEVACRDRAHVLHQSAECVDQAARLLAHARDGLILIRSDPHTVADLSELLSEDEALEIDADLHRLTRALKALHAEHTPIVRGLTHLHFAVSAAVPSDGD